MSTLLLFITPHYGTGSTGKNEFLIDTIEKQLRETMDTYPGVKAEYFGGPSVGVYNARADQVGYDADDDDRTGHNHCFYHVGIQEPFGGDPDYIAGVVRGCVFAGSDLLPERVCLGYCYRGRGGGIWGGTELFHSCAVAF